MNEYVTIKMSNRQYGVYKAALEFYGRFLSGQVEDIPPVLRQHILDQGSGIRLSTVQEYLRTKVRGNIFGVKHVTGGVGWNEEPLQQEIQLAYEMYRVAENLDEKDRTGNVSRQVLHYSDEPLVTIEKLL